MKRLISVVAGLGLATAIAFVGPAGAGTKNGGTSDPQPCGNGNSAAGSVVNTPTNLWPPNHKDIDILFTYTDPDGGDTTLTIIAKPHNEIIGGEEINGTGKPNEEGVTDSSGGMASDKTENDGSVTVTGSARAERSGHRDPTGDGVEDGRVYRFEYVASNDSNRDGTADDGCMSSETDDTDDLIVHVPHDQGQGAGAGGLGHQH